MVSTPMRVNWSARFRASSGERVVAHPPQFAHAARLILAQDRELDPRLLQQPRRLHGHGLQSRVKARHAPRKIDHRRRALLPERRGAFSNPCFPGRLGPVGPFALRLAERVVELPDRGKLFDLAFRLGNARVYQGQPCLLPQVGGIDAHGADDMALPACRAFIQPLEEGLLFVLGQGSRRPGGEASRACRGR